MAARIAILVLLPVSLLCSASLHAQGRLQSVRDEVREPAPPEADEDHHTCDDDHDTFAAEFFGDICLGMFRVFFAEFPEPVCYLRFPRHPYQNSYPAYMLHDPIDWPQGAPEWSQKSPPRCWAGRLSVENGDNFTDLNRFNGELFLEGSSRFGILTRWNHYHERLSTGCDHLVFGDACLTWRWLQSERVLSRIGLGMTVLDDRYDTDLGMTFHFGMDVFPVKPIVCTGTMETGFIGAADFVHGRATIGVTHNGWELFTGYDYLGIGATNLQGPLMGLRFWF